MRHLMKSAESVHVFFFQAEDGIRDLTVTGVQTCALPIWGYGDVEGLCNPANHRLHRLLPQIPFPFPLSRFLLYRRHGDPRNPARHDALEVGEIRRDIQREPVPRDPLLHVHADAGDLAASPAGPDAGVAGPTLGRDVELGERVDQGLLERAQVPVQVAAIAAQVQDGIADELPRAVERDVAAALHLDDGDRKSTRLNSSHSQISYAVFCL